MKSNLVKTLIIFTALIIIGAVFAPWGFVLAVDTITWTERQPAGDVDDNQGFDKQNFDKLCFKVILFENPSAVSSWPNCCKI